MLFSICCKRTGQPLAPLELFHALLKSIQSIEKEKGEAKNKGQEVKAQSHCFSKVFYFIQHFAEKKNGIFLFRMLFSICSKQQSSHQEEMHTEKYLFQNSKRCREENALELTRGAAWQKKIDRQIEKKRENKKEVCFSDIMQSSTAWLLCSWSWKGHMEPDSVR